MDGQQDIENRSFSDAAFYRDGSSTVEQQLLDNGQPQPRTRTFCPTLADAIKAIEDFGDLVRRNATSGISKLQLDVVALLFRLDPDLTSTRCELNAIVKQIRHNLAEPSFSAGNRW